MSVTRFCPNLFDGKLTIGHAVNIYANILQAKKSKGNFFVIADINVTTKTNEYPNLLERYAFDGLETNQEQEPILKTYKQNVFVLLKKMIPGIESKVVGMMGIATLLINMMKKNHPKFPTKISDSVVALAAIDAILGIDTIIRGKDFDSSSIFFMKEQSLRMQTHEMLLETFLKKKIKYYYTPLLVDNEEEKISRKNKIKEYSLTYLFESGMTALSILSYIIDLFNEKHVAINELLDYHNYFDIEELQHRKSFNYSFYDLKEHNHLVTTEIKDIYKDDFQFHSDDIVAKFIAPAIKG